MCTGMPDHHVRPIRAARHHVWRAPLLTLGNICFIREPDFSSCTKWEVNRLPTFDPRVNHIANRIVPRHRAEAPITGSGLPGELQFSCLDLGTHFLAADSIP